MLAISTQAEVAIRMLVLRSTKYSPKFKMPFFMPPARQLPGKIAIFKTGYSRVGARVFRIWGSGIQGYSEVFEGIRQYGTPFLVGKNGI